MNKKTSFVALLFLSTMLTAQVSKVNTYKYITVAKKFDFLKKSNQYQTSSLTKFLLQKNGFDVFLEDEKLPATIVQNKCKSLSVNVVDESSMLTVKNRIIFKDCYGKEIFVSEVGKSKYKEYKKAYHEAIRNAYNSISEDLKYIGNSTKTEEQTKVKEVLEPLKNDDLDIKKPTTKTVEFNQNNTKPTVLYAQPKANGFQLINTKPEVVFTILKTKIKDVYIISSKNGILYKKEQNWIAEYYKNDTMIQEVYVIKF